MKHSNVGGVADIYRYGTAAVGTYNRVRPIHMERSPVAGKLLGEIISIDASGNLISDITEESLAGVPRDDSVSVACDGHRTVGIYPSEHDQPEMTLLAYVNNDNQLTLGIVGESAEMFLGIKTGSSVVVAW